MRTTYDHIVVGAGSAGCAVAHRLADRPGARVLLLEQGQRNDHWSVRIPGAAREPFKPGSSYMRRITSVPQRHMNGRAFDLPVGVGLGGSSLVNGMVFLRGQAKDYDAWRDAGAVGWGYKDVLPRFRRLETMAQGTHPTRGHDGPIGVQRVDALGELEAAFRDAGKEAGFSLTEDVNGPQSEGFGRFDFNTRHGYRSSSGYGYLERTRRRGTLVVETMVAAQRLVIEGCRVVGVTCLDRDRGPRTYYADRDVVLSAGALATPKLLMLSGIGPADDLMAFEIGPVVDLPGVGANLHDHVELDPQWHCRHPVTRANLLKPHRMLWSGLQWLLAKSGPAAMGTCHVGAMVRTSDGVDRPNLELMLFPIGFDGWVPRGDIHAFRITAMLSRPLSRGKLQLNSADPGAPPVVDPAYLDDDRDIEALCEAHDLVADLVQRPSLEPYVGEPLTPMPTDRNDIVDMIRRTANPGYHYCGTCRMGAASDPMTVVTPDAKVKGVDNLRIADASIMPEITSCNINAPVMMIGERCADLIMADAA